MSLVSKRTPLAAVAVLSPRGPPAVVAHGDQWRDCYALGRFRHFPAIAPVVHPTIRRWGEGGRVARDQVSSSNFAPPALNKHPRERLTGRPPPALCFSFSLTLFLLSIDAREELTDPPSVEISRQLRLDPATPPRIRKGNGSHGHVQAAAPRGKGGTVCQRGHTRPPSGWQKARCRSCSLKSRCGGTRWSCVCAVLFRELGGVIFFSVPRLSRCRVVAETVWIGLAFSSRALSTGGLSACVSKPPASLLVEV